MTLMMMDIPSACDIDNRNNIPDTSPQSDFNEADYDDYLKEKMEQRTLIFLLHERYSKQKAQ